MNRNRMAALIGTLLLSAGCIPVTEPLSDPEEAKPDERLIGKWVAVSESGRLEPVQIDTPDVTGNPKGLMRYSFLDTSHTNWFFTTTIGEHTYATVFQGVYYSWSADFHKEGAFAKWNAGTRRCYAVLLYEVEGEGDEVKVTMANEEKLEAVMKVASLTRHPETGFIKAPPGWLAKYLEENGPASLFEGGEVLVLRRVKE